MILGRLIVVILLCCGTSCYRPPAAGDLDPDAAPDAAPDAQPDAVGDATPDGTACSPACSADDTQLLTCSSNNAPGPAIDCDIACGDTPSPHCLQPILSNDVEAGLPLGVGEIARNCSGTALVFYANGQVIQNGIPLRGAGLGVVSGIGFHQVGSLLVFSFESLALTDCVVRTEGNRPLALVARSTMTLDTIHAQFTGSLGILPPGGTTYCARGGSTPGSGGGGGGAASAGGKGGDLAIGGDVCTTPLVGPMTGSMGGRGVEDGGLLAGQGGPPGGALQLSARYQLQITASTFSLGGAGGEGALGNKPAGGGGSGGTVIFEANNITFSGRVYANGGGGGGVMFDAPANGADGPDTEGPLTAPLGFLYGGLGRSRDGNSIYPATPGTSTPDFLYRGGGGGGLGFVRLNTNSLSLDPTSVFGASSSQATLPLQ